MSKCEHSRCQPNVVLYIEAKIEMPVVCMSGNTPADCLFSEPTSVCEASILVVLWVFIYSSGYFNHVKSLQSVV